METHLGFNKLGLHLELVHGMEPGMTPQVVRGWFDSVPTVRPLPMLEYFPPIVDTWLTE